MHLDAPRLGRRLQNLLALEVEVVLLNVEKLALGERAALDRRREMSEGAFGELAVVQRQPLDAAKAHHHCVRKRLHPFVTNRGRVQEQPSQFCEGLSGRLVDRLRERERARITDELVLCQHELPNRGSCRLVGKRHETRIPDVVACEVEEF